MTAMLSDSRRGAGGRMTPLDRPAGGEVMRGRQTQQKVIRDLLLCARRGIGGVVLVDVLVLELELDELELDELLLVELVVQT